MTVAVSHPRHHQMCHVCLCFVLMAMHGKSCHLRLAFRAHHSLTPTFADLVVQSDNDGASRATENRPSSRIVATDTKFAFMNMCGKPPAVTKMGILLKETSMWLSDWPAKKMRFVVVPDPHKPGHDICALCDELQDYKLNMSKGGALQRQMLFITKAPVQHTLQGCKW